MEKNDYKYGYYIISLEKKNIFYVFKKKEENIALEL